jgi:uncharacterized protein DUF6916
VGDQLTHEAFAKNVLTRFKVSVDADRIVELELTEVSEPKVFPGQEQFAIIFQGPSDTFLGQGTRLLDHAVMGSFDLFLVPIKQDEHGFYYEAVFNRIRETR